MTTMWGPGSGTYFIQGPAFFSGTKTITEMLTKTKTDDV